MGRVKPAPDEQTVGMEHASAHAPGREALARINAFCVAGNMQQTQMIRRLSCLAWLAAALSPARLAWGAPPLLVAAEVAAPDLHIYVRAGGLMVVQPSPNGKPTALRPLIDDTTVPVPADLSGWTRLKHAPCTGPVPHRWLRQDTPIVVRAAGTWQQPRIDLTMEELVISTGTLRRPSRICRLHAGQLDALPGEEIVVLWQTAPDATPTGANVLGVSVLRIPETAQ